MRPASLVGPVTDALLPGLFEAVRLLGIRDARCHWQFCHVDDLLDALVAASLGQVSGAVTVGCDGWLSRANVETIAGMRSVVLPSSVAFATADRLHRVGVLASPSSDMHYLVHPWVVGSQQLRATRLGAALDQRGRVAGASAPARRSRRAGSGRRGPQGRDEGSGRCRRWRGCHPCGHRVAGSCAGPGEEALMSARSGDVRHGTAG